MQDLFFAGENSNHSVLVFDGSWTGLLCCVYDIYQLKLGSVTIEREDTIQHDAFGQIIHVISDEKRAKRVWQGLVGRISQKSMAHLYSCYLSELPGIAVSICEFIRMSYDQEESPENAFANPTVLRISRVDRMVHREKHRMEAFVRFQLTADEIFYASIEPDFNVLPLIAKHFKNRYADQRWLIYDLKRKYGIYYDLTAVSEVKFEVDLRRNAEKGLVENDELLYQNLWQDYFKHVNIAERNNKKLHLRHVPKRYWKYLTEKIA